jgi:hypothetical protein
VNAFFNLRRTGLTYALREDFKGHLSGLAIAHHFREADFLVAV